jgi:hypothetical protein
MRRPHQGCPSGSVGLRRERDLGEQTARGTARVRRMLNAAVRPRPRRSARILSPTAGAPVCAQTNDPSPTSQHSVGTCLGRVQLRRRNDWDTRTGAPWRFMAQLSTTSRRACSSSGTKTGPSAPGAQKNWQRSEAVQVHDMTETPHAGARAARGWISERERVTAPGRYATVVSGHASYLNPAAYPNIAMGQPSRLCDLWIACAFRNLGRGVF